MRLTGVVNVLVYNCNSVCHPSIHAAKTKLFKYQILYILSVSNDVSPAAVLSLSTFPQTDTCSKVGLSSNLFKAQVTRAEP